MADVQAVRIAGERVTGEESRAVVSPFDGTEVGRVPVLGRAEVDRAVAAARAALDEPFPPWRRAEVLDTASRLIGERAEELAGLIAMEAAKPLKQARVEAQRAASTFAFGAAAARTLAGEVVPLDASDNGEGKVGFVLRVPIGVVGAITPFNFPLNLVAHKLAPAIAAGCPVVVKPAGSTPLSAIALADLLLDECGLPPGLLHVVTGPGSEVGDALVRHPDVALITFTGSADVGWQIRADAPRKKVNLELGNNAPLIVHADGDWEVAADKVSVHGFSHAGQSCISTQRVYVHRSVADRFVERLVAKVGALVVGDPRDEATDVSSLITTGDTERVAAWIAEAVEAGATVACGGEVVDGLLQPTVLTGVTPDMRVSREEVFGPVVAVARYDDVDDALGAANDTRFGLQAAVFTADLGLALRAGRELRFGAVLVNEVPTWRADQMPYGGVGDSGNTREGPAYAVREMTERRLVILQG
jgi:acyl-CoA reductase-like NAD-dependent aldehyde dehydrogenase